MFLQYWMQNAYFCLECAKCLRYYLADVCFQRVSSEALAKTQESLPAHDRDHREDHQLRETKRLFLWLMTEREQCVSLVARHIYTLTLFSFIIKTVEEFRTL